MRENQLKNTKKEIQRKLEEKQMQAKTNKKAIDLELKEKLIEVSEKDKQRQKGVQAIQEAQKKDKDITKEMRSLKKQD
jgi:RNA-splicing ligase RtcB